jgi:predicted SAM-dependent methyltransferase
MSLQIQIDQLLAKGADLKLQLGCGDNLLPGWINTDSHPGAKGDFLDCTARLPFDDASLAVVFSEHMIEHIEKSQAVALIREIYRSLRPNGAIRIVTPSFDNIAQMIAQPEGPDAVRYLEFYRRRSRDERADIADACNLLFYGYGHRHLFRHDELRLMLANAGFGEINVMAAGTFCNPVFNGVDAHGRVIGQEVNAIEAFAAEAIRI